MGTDIHPFVEIDYYRADHGTDHTPFSLEGYIRCFNLGEFFVFQDYKLFSALSNACSLRGYKEKALYPPRGLPKYVTYRIARRYFPVVEKNEINDSSLFVPPLPPVSKAEADEWVSSGLCDYYSISQIKGFEEYELLVSNPDWHSTSWLYLNEIRKTLDYNSIALEDTPIEFQIIVEIMENFKKK